MRRNQNVYVFKLIPELFYLRLWAQNVHMFAFEYIVYRPLNDT